MSMEHLWATLEQARDPRRKQMLQKQVSDFRMTLLRSGANPLRPLVSPEHAEFRPLFFRCAMQNFAIVSHLGFPPYELPPIEIGVSNFLRNAAARRAWSMETLQCRWRAAKLLMLQLSTLAIESPEVHAITHPSDDQGAYRINFLRWKHYCEQTPAPTADPPPSASPPSVMPIAQPSLVAKVSRVVRPVRLSRLRLMHGRDTHCRSSGVPFCGPSCAPARSGCLRMRRQQ